MSIESEIGFWDGKSSSDIAAIYDKYQSEDGFVERLFSLSSSSDFQTAATWMIKRHLEQ